MFGRRIFEKEEVNAMILGAESSPTNALIVMDEVHQFAIKRPIRAKIGWIEAYKDFGKLEKSLTGEFARSMVGPAGLEPATH